MKKSNLLRLCLCLAVALFELPLMAQGLIVYKNDGTPVKFPYAEIDSIVTYNPVSTIGVAVDLGLSVKWASCNVGASSPEEYGGYFAWGEIEEKSVYGYVTYKWYNGSEETMTKYNTSSYWGPVDNKTMLEPEDDVAHVKWGDGWRMPTLDEMQELVDECTWTWTTLNGVNGYNVTGPNGNSIFLPAAGDRESVHIDALGANGYYWSSTVCSGEDYQAHNLYFGSEGSWCNSYDRSNGRPVRPVTE